METRETEETEKTRDTEGERDTTAMKGNRVDEHEPKN